MNVCHTTDNVNYVYCSELSLNLDKWGHAILTVPGNMSMLVLNPKSA